MRSAKESNCFPYSSQTVCYIKIDQHGDVTQVDHSFASVSEAYADAVKKRVRLYAVWPGQYRSDLFEIDDLNAFADAFGVPRPDAHVHDIEWKLSSIDDGKSSYAYVTVIFKCGCTLDFAHIKKFANDMRVQKGWDVATSTGISGNGSEYSVKVKRSSLR